MSSVDVVVPCYRYGSLLRDCVGSVLTQVGVDVRVLIVDDASPDDSAEVARQLAAEDPRVEVIVHGRNIGHIATYNEGLLGWCKADYSVLLSADDQLTPGALYRAAALLDAHPGVGFVYGHYLRIAGGAAPPRPRTDLRGWTVRAGHDWLARRFRSGGGCIASPEVVVRTSLQQRLGGYDPALPHTGDIEMWMRFAANADVGYLRGVDQAYYRIHDANMSTARYVEAGGLGDLRQRLAAYETVLRTQGHLLPDAAALDTAVRRRIAREAVYRASRAYDRRRTATVPVEALVAFAEQTWPGTHRLPEYAGLRLRRRIGPRAMPYLQPLVLSALTHKAQERLWWETWKRTGV